MKEQDFEDILSKYTELVEEGLTLKGRQVHVRGKYVDLLFEDRHGQTLIVELKKGVIKREHTAQLMDYAGHYLSTDDPTARVMLVGNRVPPNLRRSLDHFGFEWKEITVSSLIEFLREKDDKEFLSYFREEELKLRQRPAQKKSLPRAKTVSRTGLPRLQDARSFSELGDIIRARYPSYPTDYMDLLLLENKDKPLSAILEEFQQYAKKVDYKAFENINYLLGHIRYRESRGWVFDSSGDPIDPVVRLVGFEPDQDAETKRQLGTAEKGTDKGRIFTPNQFYESSYFRLCPPTSQSLLRHLMGRADSLGMRYVMKVRGDGAVAISDITSPGRNFATVWPRQNWFVAIVIGHTGRESYHSEEEIDSVLVPLIEKKYEEITGQVVRLAGLESDRDLKTESALKDSESEGRKIFERLMNMEDWQKQETFTYHRKSQLKKVLDEFGSRIPYSFFADNSRNRNSEIYPVILACHFGRLKVEPEGLVEIKYSAATYREAAKIISEHPTEIIDTALDDYSDKIDVSDSFVYETNYKLEDLLNASSQSTRVFFASFHNEMREFSNELVKQGYNPIWARTHKYGLTYFASDRKAFVFLNIRQNFISLVLYTGGQEIEGVVPGNWIKGDDRKGGTIKIRSDHDIHVAVNAAKRAYYIAANQ